MKERRISADSINISETTLLVKCTWFIRAEYISVNEISIRNQFGNAAFKSPAAFRFPLKRPTLLSR